MKINFLHKLPNFNSVKIFCLLFIGLQSSFVWGKEMKEQVIEFAHIEYKNILNNATLKPQQRLYQLSMPLLVLAALKENDAYEHVLMNMELILTDGQQQLLIQNSWKLWMTGRMALASKLSGNIPKLNALKETLSTQLIISDNNDIITGWAIAYLAAIDVDSYEKCREKLFAHTEFAQKAYQKNPTKEASNLVWTLVMNLYAAANAANTEDYSYFQQRLKNLTPENSLKDATRLVPEDDYRQWLVSLARYSFHTMKDDANLDELKSITHSDIRSLDTMLSASNDLLFSVPDTE